MFRSSVRSREMDSKTSEAEEKFWKVPEIFSNLLIMLDPLSIKRLTQSGVVDKKILEKSLSSKIWAGLIKGSSNGHPVQKMTKKNVHEEPYFRSLSVSNHPPSQACSEAHKVILNLPSP